MPSSSHGQTAPGAPLGVATLAFGLVAVGIGVDLVLPAVPMLPQLLGGTTASAQFVLAGYVAGAAAGLIGIGWLADHVDRRVIFIGSIAAFALFSFLGAMAGDMTVLIAIRVIQGAASSGPIVVAAGMVRVMFDDLRAVRVMGFLGSIQSLVPALAPVAGAWLAISFGWASTFLATGIAAGLVFAAIALRPQLLPAGRSGAGPGVRRGTYRELFANPAYLRHAIGYALVLGGLLVFVFAAPVMIVTTMGGTITEFVVLQVIGIATFITFANLSGHLAVRVGGERLVLIGTVLAVLSSLGMLVYGIFGGSDPAWLIPLWIPMNIGMGLRGPTSFVGAVAAAGTNDARASALVGLFLTAVTAIGTAIVAPFLVHGLTAVAVAMLAIVTPALVLLAVLPGERATRP